MVEIAGIFYNIASQIKEMKAKNFFTCFKRLFLVFLFLSCSYSRAQFAQAAHLIVSGDYEGAKSYYLKVLEKDSTNFSANQELGLLLLQYFDDKESALTYMERALRHVAKRELLQELYLGYAQALHFNSQYKDAIGFYEKIIPVVQDNERGKKIKNQALLSIEHCHFAIKTPPTKNSLKFKLHNLGGGINTAYPELLPVVDPENTSLFFTARRSIDLGDKKEGPEDKSHGEMFIATHATGKFESGLPFFKQNYAVKYLDNTNDYDDVISMSADGKNIFIYRANQLYLLQQKDGVWGTPVLLPAFINNGPKFEGHACISKNGKVIYFSTTRVDGYGGKDLYKTVLSEAGTWGEPENLGEEVNGPQDEDAPFLNADENTLFFSSNGPNSYGVFMAKVSRTGAVSKPLNMKWPLNSPADDIYFSLNEDETEGYLASSRKGGYGDLDIYHVLYYGKSTPKNCLQGYNPNINHDPYLDFSLKDSVFVNDRILFDAGISSVKGGKILNYFWRVNDTLITADTAKFEKKFTREGKYTVSLEAAVYYDTSDYRHEFCISKEVFVFSPKAVDVFFEPLVKKDEDKLVIKGTMDIASMRIDSTKKSILKIQLEPVFFNTNKFDLRKDAIEAIRKNIAKMKVDASIVIKLTARTDSRSNKEYNLSLSQKRANSVIAYLEKNGIKKKRILAVLAIGEEGAAIKNCGTDVDCQEKVYQQNRRVDFKVVGAEYQAPADAKAKKPAAKKGPVAKKKK
jgi:outer membrane protein OmpA-like peptidoglycan-associated protein/tetratricopeptide (TPR) repeat protein